MLIDQVMLLIIKVRDLVNIYLLIRVGGLMKRFMIINMLIPGIIHDI